LEFIARHTAYDLRIACSHSQGVRSLTSKGRLWDQNDLIDQFLAAYDRLDENIRAEIPLKRTWVVAAQDPDVKE
jgi:hypothetical protein